MDDFKQEQPELEQPDEEMTSQVEQPRRGRNFLSRLGILVVTILIVLGVVTVALLGEGNYLDRFRRWLNYGSATEENQYLFAADEHNRFGQIGEYLVLLNQNYLQFLSEDGTAYQAVEGVAMSQPALDVGKDTVVAYDVGGQNLLLASPEAVMMEQSLSGTYRYISARLNSKDWLAVTAEKSGYKGGVSVYNNEQELVYEADISSQFVIDAMVSEDCKSLIVVTLGEENGAFCTRLVRYNLDSTEPASVDVLTDHLSFDLGVVGSSYASVAEGELAFTTGTGSVAGIYSFGDLFLADYSLGEKYAAVLLNRYRAGSIGKLVTVDDRGQVIASMDVSDEILDISVAGDYLAVLQSNALVLYTQDLQVYSRLENTSYASRVLANADGSALVITNSSAWRYLP